MVGVLGAPSLNYYWIFAGEASHVYTTPPTITNDIMGYARTADLNAELAKTFAVDATFTVSAYEFTNASSPDMDAFRTRGGKIMFVGGTADWAFSPFDLENYYKTVQARYGSTAAGEFARLFLVPGMDHVSGGQYSTDGFDGFAALRTWVERGTAPDMMMAVARSSANTAWTGRTRPLCAYPKEAVYSGAGDIENGRNFSCQ
jgi:feruloyl esterase